MLLACSGKVGRGAGTMRVVRPNGQQSTWDWSSKLTSFRVDTLGDWKVKLFRNGGYFSKGEPVGDIVVTVLDPVKLLSLNSGEFTAGESMLVSYELVRRPRLPYQLLLEFKSVNALETATISDIEGSVQFSVPRYACKAGDLTVVMRATSERSSVLATCSSYSISVDVPAQHEASAWVNHAAQAAVCLPGGPVALNWNWPLCRVGDVVGFVPLCTTGEGGHCHSHRYDAFTRASEAVARGHAVSTISGNCTLTAPSSPGAYAIVLLACHRQCLYVVAHEVCHVLVSELAAPHAQRAPDSQATPAPAPAPTPAHQAPQASGGGGGGGSPPECSVCLSATVDSVLQPCMHIGLCALCASRVRGTPCPFCRAEVTGVSRVYFP